MSDVLSMAKARSRNKGAGWERDLSRELSQWFTGNSDELVCWRAPGSGSVSTNALKRGGIVRATGDVVPLQGHPLPQFFDEIHVDAKSMKTVDLWISADNLKSNVLLQNWRKTCKDASANNKHALMVVHWRQKKTKFAVVTGAIWRQLVRSGLVPGFHTKIAAGPDCDLYIYPWKLWLTAIKPQDIMGVHLQG